MKRKGYRREAGSEGSVEQRCEPMNKNRIRGASAGRAGNESRSPYPSRAQSVDPGGCALKAIELTPGDLLRVVRKATEATKRSPDRGAEVSRRHSRSSRRQG